MRNRSWTWPAVAATSAALAGLLAGPGPALASPHPALAGPHPTLAAACRSKVPGQPPDPGGGESGLSGVAVLSACDVWVVGSDTHGTLTEHWNGSAWKVVPSPSVGGKSGELFSVAAVSPSNIWAAGDYQSGGQRTVLILHWDGTRWLRAATPHTGGDSILEGVWAASGRDAYAVGWSRSSQNAPLRSLILHWNGSGWARAASPELGHSSELAGVSGTSAADVWAVGGYYPGSHQQALVLHWDGARWTRVPSPSTPSNAALSGVSSVSGHDVWAAGSVTAPFSKTLVLHWDGTSWKRMASPNPRDHPNGDFLAAVAAASSRDVWAVGGDLMPMTLHWDGSAWQVPNKANVSGTFVGAAADRAGDAWAVGDFVQGTHNRGLAVRLH